METHEIPQEQYALKLFYVELTEIIRRKIENLESGNGFR